jgi:aminoglycoside/choline kinase family phosphotransferase
VQDEQLSRLFEAHFGVAPLSILPLAGDGSPRKLFRFIAPDGQTAIGVYGPDREENTAFLSFSRSFRKIGLNVPEIYGAAEESGVYLEEDLGDTTLFDALNLARSREKSPFPESMIPVYKRVVEELPRFQVHGGRAVDYSVAYPRAAFDRQSILWDLNYFKYHFLKLAGIPFNEARLEDDFLRFTDYLTRADSSHFLYRDFQSRNVMLRDGEPWFVDYQGGRRGALQYDLASILYDAKAGLPQELRESLFDHYLDALGQYIPVDREEFRACYRGYVLVRIMQAMGAYGYRGFFERKLRFLQSVPAAIVNIERLLAGDWIPVELPELRLALTTICQTPRLRQTAPAEKPGLTVRVSSFSFRHGYPEDASGHGGGYVFDVRAVHNPGRYAEYINLSGLDAPVSGFLDREPDAGLYWESVRSLVDLQVQSYLTRGFTSLSVAFGCTGGQHRSVYFAERLARHLRERFPGINVEVGHRERGRWPGSTSASAPATGPGDPDLTRPG